MRANDFDVLIIGEGLSGITAAASACKQGARVMLVSKGPGSFVLGAACVDLDGFKYASLGLRAGADDDVGQAVGFFIELAAAAECAYEGGVREHRLVPTIMGTFADVSLAPRQLWKGDPRGLGKAVVIGIENLFAFDPNFVGERLSAHSKNKGLTTSYRATAIRLPQLHRQRWLTPLEIGSEFDNSAFYRHAMVEALKPVVQDADLLIIPGVLGVNSGDNDIRHLEDEICCAICELPSLPPSVPGLRLLRRLESHLSAIGVEVLTGFTVQKLCMEAGRCRGAVLDTPGKLRTVHANSVILASGRYSHLLQEGGAGEYTAGSRVEVNQELQPMNGDAGPLAENVFACGSILGKFESRYRNALAVVSGHQAGMLACQRGVHYAKP